jgi:hypothetical protein
MFTIVICCRTSDSFGISGRIFDCLVEHFGRGNVFLDDLNANDSQFDRMKFGEIQDRARKANIVLASVGQNWLNGIQDESDPVRLVIPHGSRIWCGGYARAGQWRGDAGA